MPDFASSWLLCLSWPVFRLSAADISDDGLKNLAGLKRLNGLCLDGTLVRNPLAVLSIDRNRFGTLDLNDTPLDDEAFDEIGKCVDDGELHLTRTQLTDDRLLRLNFAETGTLNIADNPLELSEEAIRQLVRFDRCTWPRRRSPRRKNA